MADDPRSVRAGEQIDPRRLWWAGPLTVAVALAANAVIRAVAIGLFEISPLFHNLAWIHFTWVTSAAVSSAVVVYAVISLYAKHPVAVYRRVAIGALVANLLPNVWLLLSDVPGGSPAAHTTLIVMHIVDAAICIYLLPALTYSRESAVEPLGDPHEATISTR